MNPIPLKWKTPLYPAIAILAGLVTAQVIATFQVFFANQSLYHTLTAIGARGYVTIPNDQTMGRLQELSAALGGGLFLTLSVGAGISVLSLVAAWLWDRVGVGKTFLLVPLFLLWAGFSVGVNWNGFSLFTTLYCLLIPPAVFAGALALMPRGNRKQLRRNGLLRVIPIIVLGVLWAPQMEKGLFINIRDYLLLSNPVGERVVDFYYQYTLYPAEILKPLDRKLLKTCSLNSIMEGPQKTELHKALLTHDWIETENKKDVDLVLSLSGNTLILENGGGITLEIPGNEFRFRPAAALKRFSSRADRHRVFRQFTFYSLLMGFPITLYIFLYSLFLFLTRIWVAPRIAEALSAMFCFLAGLMLLIPLWQLNWHKVDHNNPGSALESHNRYIRVNTLKNISERHLDLSAFSAHKTHLTSPYTTERYWLAKALGTSRNHGSHEILLGFLKDPSPVVVSAALFSLGRRGEKKAIPKILQCIKTSDHWYVQWYAYRALKTLGWQQKKRSLHIDSDP